MNLDGQLPSQHPPRPRLALRVAAAGHRPDHLPDPGGVRDALESVLTAVRKAARDAHGASPESNQEPPLLRLVTALAEGTDRIAATVALDLGYELQAILPFAREDYLRDFARAGGGAIATASVAEIDEFLADQRTTAVLELDGVLLLSHAAEVGTADTERGESELSAAHIAIEEATPPYEALAEVLLRQSDLLVVVWDGESARGPGGTANIVRDARTRGLPTIVIHAGDPERIDFTVSGTARPYREEDLRELLFAMWALGNGAAQGPLQAYLSERMPGWYVGGRRLPVLGSRSLLNWVWPTFRGAISGGWPHRPTLSVGLRASAASTLPGPEPAALPLLHPVLQPHYAWADSLATYYGDRYRSAFVVIYLLGVATVGLAALGLANRNLGHVGPVDIRLWLTLGLLLLIVGIWYVGGSVKRWHRRWLDYRILAEYLRQLAHLVPLAGSSPRVRVPPHRSSGDPGNSWMAWHTRAVAREMGIVAARFDGPFLASARTEMRKEWVDAQAAYHRENAKRSLRMERVLHWSGLVLFALAFVTVAAAIFREIELLTAFEAMFPALGSAIAGIRGQAELERLARRSEGVAEWLEDASAKLALASPHPGTSASRGLRATAESAAAAMLDEVLDWRVVLEIRPLELPV